MSLKHAMVMGLGLALCAGVSTQAGDQAAPEHKQKGALFEKWDTDGNGKVTLEEFMAAREANMRKQFERKNSGGTFEEFFATRKDRLEKEFKRMDTDGDGKLTADEWAAARGKHGTRMDKQKAQADKAEKAADTNAASAEATTE